jgi:putative oxidoreductase
LLAGEMAVAYFWIHFGGGEPWWWQNGGELAMLFSFIFLLYSAWGAGRFSLDAKLAARRE